MRIFDLAMAGVTHTNFNSSFIAILQNVWKNENIIFYGEKNNVKKTTAQGVRKIRLPFYPKETVLKNLIYRDFVGSFYALWSILICPKNERLIYLMVLPLSHWMIFLANKLCKRDITICLHGHVEAYVENSILRGTKYYFNVEKPLFKNQNIKYIVLGESIYQNIKHIFGTKTKAIIIDHPYMYSEKNEHNLLFQPLVVGQIGLGDKGKGTHYMFALAELLKDEIQQGKVKIKLVGKLNPKLIYLDNGLVEYATTMLDAQEFTNRIQSLHYTLQLRDNTMGKAVASGSFFDTIKYEKPFFSLDNEYIGYYMEKYKGIGTAYSNVQEIANAIKEIIQNKETALVEYKHSIEVIKEMQKDLSLESIATKFKAQL